MESNLSIFKSKKNTIIFPVQYSQQNLSILHPVFIFSITVKQKKIVHYLLVHARLPPSVHLDIILLLSYITLVESS